MPFQVVTGGAGFIGSHLVHRLLSDGQEVAVVDDFSTGSYTNIAAFREHPGLKLHEVSILDLGSLARIFQGADCVFHQAAIPSVQRSVERPLETHDVNITGTLNVLLAARQAGVRRVVYASSSSVYGDSEVLPKSEEFPPQPLSPYALQKYAAEAYLEIFFKLFRTGATALRYFNVFGPRQDPASEYSAVIPRFVTAMLQGQPPTIYGDGEQSRDFTYVDNIVDANLKAASSPAAEGQVMNIALGEQVTLNCLVSLLNEILDTKIRPIYRAARPGDIRHSRASVERARRLIGFAPVVDLKTGLRRTVEWYASRLSEK